MADAYSSFLTQIVCTLNQYFLTFAYNYLISVFPLKYPPLGHTINQFLLLQVPQIYSAQFVVFMLIFLSSNNSNPSILLINDSLFLLYYSSSPTHLFFYNNYAFYINYMQGERSVGFTYQKNKESVLHIKRIRISQRIGLPFLS